MLDRRILKRLPATPGAECYVFTHASGSPDQAVVCDASSLGLGLRLPHPIEPATPIVVGVYPYLPALSHHVTGRVTHCRADEDGSYRVGARLNKALSAQELLTILVGGSMTTSPEQRDRDESGAPPQGQQEDQPEK
jgi:PilZ domain